MPSNCQLSIHPTRSQLANYYPKRCREGVPAFFANPVAVLTGGYNAR